MKSIKITLWLFSAVVTLTVIVLLFLLNNLNAVIKDAVEIQGPEVTKTDVKLGKVDISLIESSVALNSLAVANPKGFDVNTPLLTVREITLNIDPSTLYNKVKVVRELVIDGVEITAEHKNLRDTNIEGMIENIKRSSGTAQSNKNRQQPQQQTAQQGEEIRLMIEKLTFSNSSVTLVTEQWGKHSIELPGFSKTAIGDKTEGLTPKQLAREVMSAYMGEVSKLIGDKLKELAKSKLEKKFDEYKQKIFKKIGVGE